MTIKASDFGENFFWGISSSAPQTEGATNVGGRGNSIWDDFSRKRSKIRNGDTPDIATEFYLRYKEDIQLVKKLGLKNFRISISWSRILPNGEGEVNLEGIQFYHRVFDECLNNGIQPWVTLYHWDLPAALERQGGWTNRKILEWFEQYVSICGREFGNKVRYWMILNEPMVFTGAGYFLGVHAPGKKGIANFLKSMHHAVLCQSIGFRTLKTLVPDSVIGTTFSCSYITPYSNSKRDQQAALRIDALLNRTFIEPSLGLGYPIEVLPFLKKVRRYMMSGDDQLMKAEFDFIGIQNYTREVVANSYYIPYLQAKLVPADKRKVFYTQMDWEVYPEAIYEMIKKFDSYSGVKKIIVTENGAAFEDELLHGKINDLHREQFIRSYLEQVLKSQKECTKIGGYFIWSLTDNFEWAEGYQQRFGLIYVDFKSQQRYLKNSAYWYQKFLHS